MIHFNTYFTLSQYKILNVLERRETVCLKLTGFPYAPTMIQVRCLGIFVQVDICPGRHLFGQTFVWVYVQWANA